MTRLRSAVAVAAAALLTIVLMPSAFAESPPLECADHLDEIVFDGAIKLDDIGSGTVGDVLVASWVDANDDPVASPGITVTVTKVKNDDDGVTDETGAVGEVVAFSWVSDDPIVGVLVVAGGDTVVYTYDGETSSGTIDLTTPDDKGASHITFCFGDGDGGIEEDPVAKLTVEKFYDADADGEFDEGEALIEGWEITVTHPDESITTESTTYTLEVGEDGFGTYGILESDALEDNWVHTTDTSETVELEDGSDETVQFGNVCLGGGGGHTIGFWGNKNGQALIGADELTALSALNLRNANGSDFDPGSAIDVKNWLRKATATNMAYMLSAQLAAMQLNVLNGFVDGSALVYDGTAFVTIDDLIAAADAALAGDGLTLAGDPNRALQDALKNALDDANNNENFVQAEACDFTFAAPELEE